MKGGENMNEMINQVVSDYGGVALFIAMLFVGIMFLFDDLFGRSH